MKTLLIALVIVALIIIIGSFRYFQTEYYHGPTSDHFDGKHFFNPGYHHHKSVFDLLKWWWSGNRATWPEWVINEPQAPLKTITDINELRVTFINHSTVLLQTSNINFLTDPIWSDRASPFFFWGPKRVRAPGVQLHELPRIDVILISHNHYDHMNIETLLNLKNKFDPVFVVPLGNASILKNKGIKKIIELDWWQTYKFKNSVITLLPALHWSARWLNDKYRALWGSYGIQVGSLKVYFAGDTGYSDFFAKINARWGNPSIAFLPIGSYEPRWFMKDNHMNPAEAVRALKDLHGEKAIAIHYNTFQLSDEAIDQPVKDLTAAMESQRMDSNDFIILKEGASYTIKK